VVACVLALSTAACGAPSSPGDAETPVRHHVLNQAELNRVLLTDEAIGKDFVSQSLGWSINPSGWPGCLSSLNGITYFAAPTRETLVGIHADTEARFPLVVSTAAAFSTEKEAAVALPALREKLVGCTRVAESDDGLRFVLRVSHDDEHRTDAVDDQVNVAASGSMRRAGGTVPLSFGFTAVRVGNNLLLTCFLTSRKESVTAEATQVTDAAVARLAAVVAGKPVPRTSLDLEPVGASGGGTAV
jgi:hypothetical protein